MTVAYVNSRSGILPLFLSKAAGSRFYRGIMRRGQTAATESDVVAAAVTGGRWGGIAITELPLATAAATTPQAFGATTYAP